MDFIDCSQENATRWFKYFVETKRFLQASVIEQINNICISMIGSTYSPSNYYIMYGCARSGAADGSTGAAAVSAGAIFFNGELYTVPAFSTTDILSQNLYISVSDTTPSTKNLIDIGGAVLTTLNPVPASDGNTYNLHHQRQIVVTQAASGSVLFSTTTIGFTKVLSTTTSAGPDTTTGTYAIINSALTFTTPNDGITRHYMLMYKGQFVNSNGAASSEADIKFRNTTDSADYDTISVGKSNATSADVYTVPVSIMDVVSIGPNKTIQAWCKTTATTSSGSLYNSRFIVMEVR